ncbi:hypothetical protein BLNAU_1824 [Blattamonas nauphoetae]|uniref:Uncharacterized protein n=1 Tax=Blattamonas nauphoetae TaxID=2049346 RepID=A0ABQ9YI05_9EUKA|nr:hypothetical protein BLNAU_1824 [Blattamonas nauphoetae]
MSILSDRRFVPIIRQPFGYVQSSSYTNADYCHEEVVELDTPFSMVLGAGTAVHSILLLGDQNAGKTSFLHSFGASNDPRFIYLFNLIPYLTTSFINTRFLLDPTSQYMDEPPYLDTDLGRAMIMFTRDDWDFFCDENEVSPANSIPSKRDAQYVCVEFVEIGGDHLDRMIQFQPTFSSTSSNLQQSPLKQETTHQNCGENPPLPSELSDIDGASPDIVSLSKTLLQESNQALYFINFASLFQPISVETTSLQDDYPFMFNTVGVSILKKKLLFLSSLFAPPLLSNHGTPLRSQGRSRQQTHKKSTNQWEWNVRTFDPFAEASETETDESSSDSDDKSEWNTILSNRTSSSESPPKFPITFLLCRCPDNAYISVSAQHRLWKQFDARTADSPSPSPSPHNPHPPSPEPSNTPMSSEQGSPQPTVQQDDARINLTKDFFSFRGHQPHSKSLSVSLSSFLSVLLSSFIGKHNLNIECVTVSHTVHFTTAPSTSEAPPALPTNPEMPPMNASSTGLVLNEEGIVKTLCLCAEGEWRKPTDVASFAIDAVLTCLERKHQPSDSEHQAFITESQETGEKRMKIEEDSCPLNILSLDDVSDVIGMMNVSSHPFSFFRI